MSRPIELGRLRVFPEQAVRLYGEDAWRPARLEAWVEWPGRGWWVLVQLERRRAGLWISRRVGSLEQAAAFGRHLRRLRSPSGYTEISDTP